jgi:two-component system sensor histidine kinase BaeS
MTLSIRHKLMIAFSLLALGVTLIAFLAMLLTFRAGFLHYLNDIRYQSLESFGQIVAEKITSDRQWKTLKNNRKIWLRLVKEHRQNDSDTLLNPPRVNRSVNKTQEGRRSSASSPSSSLSSSPYKSGDFSRPFRPPSRRNPYVLLDVDSEIIYGRITSASGLLRVDVIIDNRLRGYLGINKLSDINNRADQVFVSKQTRYFIGIAIFACLLAVVVAFFIARWMTSPIQRLVVAMNRLMTRDYDHQVDYKASDEIGSLVQSFNQLSQSLAHHQQSQQRWIADISHELRTPLSTLKAELEAMQDGVRKVSMARINSLHEDVLRLQRLVDDLHELTLSDSGALNYQFSSVSVFSVLTSVFEHHEIDLNAHDVNYKIEGSLGHKFSDINDLYVYADADRLYQLFENLLQNSMRYTDSGGKISVKVAASSADAVIIEWHDSSPGVSAASLQQLFNRLYRDEKSRNRDKGGSGLGLSICKAIVEAHSGEINAQHSPLGGLKITIHLSQAKM